MQTLRLRRSDIVLADSDICAKGASDIAHCAVILQLIAVAEK